MKKKKLKEKKENVRRLRGIYPKEIKTSVHTDLQENFYSILFRIAKIWKQLNFHELMKK